MTIQELADRAEVTTRTIRYYVEQGVLQPPERGRPAEYTAEHLARLVLIKRLKEQYLPLEEIRDTLQRLSTDEVEALVWHYAPQQAQTRKLDSAADYIAGVLGRGIVREQMKQQAMPAPLSPPPSVPSPAPAEAGEVARKKAVSAPDAQADTLREPSMTNAPPAATQAPGAPPPSPPSQASDVEAAHTPSLASRLWSSVARGRPSQHESAPGREENTYIQPPTSWQRVQLGEGIELHYLAINDAGFNEMVARLLEAAHRILDEGPGNGE